MNQNKKSLPWHVVEKQILKETNWLRAVIDTPFGNEGSVPITCEECLLRKIALLIVTGRVHVKEIKKAASLASFWFNKSKHQEQERKPRIIHGADWHNSTMEKIENHFLHQNYEVEREPNLHWGRADLGVHKNGEKALYIEVGTTSLFKLLTNLMQMKNSVYLIVPNDDKLIEFTCS